MRHKVQEFNRCYTQRRRRTSCLDQTDYKHASMDECCTKYLNADHNSACMSFISIRTPSVFGLVLKRFLEYDVFINYPDSSKKIKTLDFALGQLHL